MLFRKRLKIIVIVNINTFHFRIGAGSFTQLSHESLPMAPKPTLCCLATWQFTHTWFISACSSAQQCHNANATLSCRADCEVNV